MTLPICEIDLRVGGAYRYVMRDPGGMDHTMQGVYREITPPARLVYTERYVTEGFTSNDALVTVLFAEHDGMTTLTSTILHQSKADRDAHLGTGMEKRRCRSLRSARGAYRGNGLSVATLTAEFCRQRGVECIEALCNVQTKWSMTWPIKRKCRPSRLT